MWKAILLAVVLASPASAATMRAIYMGTIADGLDETGLFGLAGADLAGAPFELAFLYNTRRGDRATTAVSDRVLGGFNFDVSDNPMLGVRLTISGVTQRFAPDAEGVAAVVSDGSSPTRTEHRAVQSADQGAIRIEGNVITGLRTAQIVVPDLDARLSLIDDDSFFQGSFVLARTNRLTGDRLDFAGGRFFTDSVTIAPVPLPASVALLGAGLAGLCLIGRRTRRREATGRRR